jgi:hypothetical protein
MIFFDKWGASFRDNLHGLWAAPGDEVSIVQNSDED